MCTLKLSYFWYALVALNVSDTTLKTLSEKGVFYGVGTERHYFVEYGKRGKQHLQFHFALNVNSIESVPGRLEGNQRKYQVNPTVIAHSA